MDDQLSSSSRSQAGWKDALRPAVLEDRLEVVVVSWVSVVQLVEEDRVGREVSAKQSEDKVESQGD